MFSSTGYAPSKKQEQIAGDYLSSSKPSYGYGSSSSGYPDPTPQGIKSGGSSANTQDWSSAGDWAPLMQSLTPDQLAQWKSIGQQYQQQSLAQQKARMDADKAVSGSAYNAQLNRQTPTDATGKAVELYSMLTPEQQQIWHQISKKEEGPGFFEAILPLIEAGLIVFGGEALLGTGGAAGGAAAGGAEAAGGVAAVTPESLAYSTGNLLASNIAPGVADTLVEGAGALGSGTLADITVTAAAGGAGAAGAGTFAALAGGGAMALDALGTGADLSGVTMPKPNYPLSSYTPKSLIRDKLVASGADPRLASIVGGSGQGALMSTITGGSPLMGALGGGVSTGVGEAVAGSGLGQSVSSAVGGGQVGDILGKAAVGGASGGLTSAILGGNPLLAAEAGAIGSGSSAALSDAGLAPGAAAIIGSSLGKAATMPTSSSGIDPSKSLGSRVMGSLSDLPLGNLLTAGTGMYAANKADKQNQALIGQISSGAQPFVTAGQDALKGYQNLTPYEQQQLNASITAGTSAQQGAQPLIGLGEQQLNIAGSGNLPPALEAQLQQQVQAAKAQLAQTYPPDSSAYQQMSAKIDQQALMTRQQMLAQYQTSGQATYAAGEQQFLAGQQEVASAYAAAQKEIDQNLSNALSMATTGLGPLADAVRMGLINNMDARNTMSDLMKSIATATATGGGGATLGNLFKSLLGGGGGGTTPESVASYQTPTLNVGNIDLSASMPDLNTTWGGTPQSIVDYQTPTLDVGNIDLSSVDMPTI